MMLTSMLDDYIRELESVYDWEGPSASEKERECKSVLEELWGASHDTCAPWNTDCIRL